MSDFVDPIPMWLVIKVGLWGTILIAIGISILGGVILWWRSIHD